MTANIFAEIPKNIPDELFQILVASEGIKIERIISRGHCSPKNFWYDQEKNEFVMLLKGSAVLSFEGEKNVMHMKPGDYINISAHRRHRVECTAPDEDAVWLAVHY